MTRLVIVGGGHAAAQLAASLAEKQFPGSIVLVSDEPEIPYHRPPLSKTLIKDPEAPLPELRGASFYEQAGITLRLGTRALSIDRAGKRLRLSSAAGQEDLAYDHLVLATGACVRELPQAPVGTPGVHYLRTYAQARALRDALPGARRVVVLGGGFIGLEIAATARHLGKEVTVFESMPRLLTRSVSPEISSFLLETHRAAGVDIRLGSSVGGLEMAQGRAVGVVSGGAAVPADIVIAGIGATPNVDLARDAGLACDNGIVVDKGTKTERISLEEVARICYFRPDTLPPGFQAELIATRHYVPRAWAFSFTNGVQASYLEVDTDTGFIKLLKHWCVEDCGTVINPQLVDEQIRGGIVQGLGGALFEHCLYDERGQMLNGNMADYLVPMAMEMPDMEVGHVVTPTTDSELGAKGAGEAGTAGAPACVMNAINDALRPLGAEPLTDMPFTPGKVLRALRKV